MNMHLQSDCGGMVNLLNRDLLIDDGAIVA
jgi:hypothetical protein